MTGNRRQEVIESIERERKSHVLAYVVDGRSGADGGIGPDAVEEMYRLLCELEPLGKKPLDLFLVAHRGDLSVPWQLVGMIREMFDLFNVILPHKAHGPATMIALGADTIIMGERGTLSPIEAFIPADLSAEGQAAEDRAPSIEDAKALMSLMEGFGRMREKQRIDAFVRMMEKVHPLLLGAMHKRFERIKADCIGLLGTRRRRFGRGANRKIVNNLLSDSASRHHHITRSEAARSIGLKQVRRDEALEPLLGELLALYEHEFESSWPACPAPSNHDFQEEEAVFSNCKLAFMESSKKTRVLVEDRKVQKVREAAPAIRLDPQIILPALEVGPEMGEERIWSFIEGWLQANLPGLIDEAFVRFKKSLPVSGYHRTSINRRWVDE